MHTCICSFVQCIRAEVSCRDVIRQARITRVKSRGMSALGSVNLKRSETGAHKVFRDFGQSLPVKISKADISTQKDYPFVKFSSWLTYLVECDMLDQLVGVQSIPDMQKLLQVFWARYKESEPQHLMYHQESGAALRPDMTVPIVIHGDEGTSHKKKQIMIISSTGVLGRGSSRCKDNDVSDLGDSNPLSLNYLGDTWLTHFLHGVMPVRLYGDTPHAFYEVLDLVADDLQSLFQNGIQIGRHRFFIAVLGIKGDAPFLSKSGRFELRSFTRKPVRSSARAPCSGICHQCLAGKEDWEREVPYENFGDHHPGWSETIGILKPYVNSSPLLRIPCLKEDTPARAELFWKFDLFHNLHLGLGKCFASSAVCVLLELLDGSIDGAFQVLTGDFQRFCKLNHHSPYHRKLTPALFGIQGGFSQCPDAGWNKGDYTRLILKWLGDYCSREVVGKTESRLYLECATCHLKYSVGLSVCFCLGHMFMFYRSLMHAVSFSFIPQADAVFAINDCISGLYSEGLFVRAPRAKYLATRGLHFLRRYASLAAMTFHARKRRFPLMPKGHYLHHQFLDLLRDSERGGWCFNILAFGNQMSEDFVGKPSRLSRSVSQKTTCLRVIQRTFLAIRNSTLL